MKFLEIIQNDLKTSMKARDNDRTRTLRMVLSKLKERRIELNEDLSEEEEIRVMKKAAKERRDSSSSFRQAGRDDLADAEDRELEIISAYLPEEMDENAVLDVVRRIISETGAESMRDIGKVMGPAMKELAGKADGKLVQACVKQLLG